MTQDNSFWDTPVPQPGEPQPSPMPVQPEPAQATQTEAAQAATQAQTAPGQPGTVPDAASVQAAAKLDSMATGALVCGILSIVFCAPVFGLILGIVAIVLAGKALKGIPANSRAKAGRVTGIVGIILSVLSTIVIIMIAVILASAGSSASSSTDFDRMVSSVTGVSATNGDEAAVRQAVDDTMATLQNVSDDDLKTVGEGIDDSFQYLIGASTSDMGLSSSDFATWLTGDMTYEIKSVDIQGSTATAYLTVHSRDVDGFLDTVESDLNKFLGSSDHANATDTAGILKQVGTILKTDMDKTGTSEKMTSLTLTKLGTTWSVDTDSLAQMEAEVYELV